MGCNSDYLLSNDYEIEISKVACLLDELDGKPFNKNHWAGYHPRVYNKVNKALGDNLVAELCSRLKTIDVSTKSLEMQMWWRDHLIADQKRNRTTT